jgi:hypothetical protein
MEAAIFTKFLLPLASGRTVAVGGVLYEGPLSVNPQGVYEAQPYTIFPPRSLQAHWNSFNLGELLLGRGLHSLLPLLLLIAIGLVGGSGAGAAFRIALPRRGVRS